ncbi:hypothetical protein F9L07_25335 [Pimelobacter simplex]|uniref:Uncharacterized protein n=1 Tax=Nocardioides simplex TaxID=2045 RepID=A0A7J5DSQ0_NOCSI|nr:hypothetical protein F9L07_25335 [Pimelobacter simplex]
MASLPVARCGVLVAGLRRFPARQRAGGWIGRRPTASAASAASAGSGWGGGGGGVLSGPGGGGVCAGRVASLPRAGVLVRDVPVEPQ